MNYCLLTRKIREIENRKSKIEIVVKVGYNVIFLKKLFVPIKIGMQRVITNISPSTMERIKLI
jgi:hypothetical protein